MDNQFSRSLPLLKEEGLEKLKKSRVVVFGIGGVGSFTVEALARAGVGAIDLIDNDVYSETNMNRQLFATRKTLGIPKVEAARERIADINPECKVTCHKLFYLPENAEQFDLTKYDYVVDAVDTVAAKEQLIISANRSGVPIISSMGAGNKLHPEMFEVADIYATSVCPLARVMRAKLKKAGIKKLKVVYSKEEPITFENSRVPASVSFVPSVAGLIIAGEVIKDIAGIK